MAHAERLDLAHIDAAARFAAGHLSAHGVARVRLTPGDMTEYHLVVTGPGAVWKSGVAGDFIDHTRDHCVALVASFGAAYPWAGQEIAPGYAAEKWTARTSSDGTRAHTGEVVARFLTALSEAMAR